MLLFFFYQSKAARDILKKTTRSDQNTEEKQDPRKYPKQRARPYTRTQDETPYAQKPRNSEQPRNH